MLLLEVFMKFYCNYYLYYFLQKNVMKKLVVV